MIITRCPICGEIQTDHPTDSRYRVCPEGHLDELDPPPLDWLGALIVSVCLFGAATLVYVWG